MFTYLFGKKKTRESDFAADVGKPPEEFVIIQNGDDEHLYPSFNPPLPQGLDSTASLPYPVFTNPIVTNSYNIQPTEKVDMLSGVPFVLSNKLSLNKDTSLQTVLMRARDCVHPDIVGLCDYDFRSERSVLQ